MDLHLTWVKYPGSDVKYIVEYRVKGSSGPYTVFATDLTTNYCTIPGLPKNFYEVRIKADCAEGDSDYIYKEGGEDPCLEIDIRPAELLEDNEFFQLWRFKFFNIMPAGATVRITNTNTNQVFATALVGDSGSGSGSWTVPLTKEAGKTIMYKVEVQNSCTIPVWQLVSDITVVGPPAVIKTVMKVTSDFCKGTGHFPVENDCSKLDKPDTGVRFTFAEPLPQSIVVVFDFRHSYCTNPGGINTIGQWDSEKHYSPSCYGGYCGYSRIVIPAGVTSYGACWVRDGGDYCQTQWCVVRVEPAILNNGKSIKFENTSLCSPIKNIKTNPYIEQYKGCLYSS